MPMRWERPALQSRSWCPAMTLLRRKPSMPAKVTIIKTFVLASAIAIFSKTSTMAGFESTTASSTTPWTSEFLLLWSFYFYFGTQRGRAKGGELPPELASVKPQRPIVSAPPEDEHRVLQFRPRPGSPLAQRGNHPPFVHRLEVANDLSRYERDREDAGDYRQRMLANVAAFAFTVALLAIGIWLTMSIAQLRRTQDCVLMGRHDCVQIVVPHN